MDGTGHQTKKKTECAQVYVQEEFVRILDIIRMAGLRGNRTHQDLARRSQAVLKTGRPKCNFITVCKNWLICAIYLYGRKREGLVEICSFL